MDVLVVLLTLVLVAGVLIVISAPLRAHSAEQRRTSESEQTRPESDRAAALEADRAALEAERATKYREIREAELDYRTGKLSREDYEAVDAALRREAIAILDSLERAQAPSGDRLED